MSKQSKVTSHVLVGQGLSRTAEPRMKEGVEYGPVGCGAGDPTQNGHGRHVYVTLNRMCYEIKKLIY